MSKKNITLHAVGYGDKISVLPYGGPELNIGSKATDMITPPVPSWTDPGTTWVYWGDNDRLPTDMREAVEKVPIAGATLAKKISMLMGNGIVYYNTADLKKGPNVERAYFQEIEDFLDNNRIQEEWFPAQCADYALPFNAFSEIALSLDQTKATGLYHISAEHARLSKANSISNQVDWLMYSYHFPFGTAQSDTNRVYMPLYKWYDSEAFFTRLRGNKFGWHTRFPTPGMIYYARPWWIGLFKKNGWMDVSGNVPVIVSAMQNNQIKLKYIIEIPEMYFIIRYPEWPQFTADDREAVIDKKIAEINAYLSGTGNVFKSLAYVFKENEITGSPLGKINIIPVDDKAKEGTWVPDSSAADSQIVQGFGMDPSQIGLAQASGQMGAGSGSDKRESYNLLITLNTPDQRIILEPLNWISRKNGWGVTFAVDHTAHTTTNNQESGMQPQKNTVVVKPAGEKP